MVMVRIVLVTWVLLIVLDCLLLDLSTVVLRPPHTFEDQPEILVRGGFLLAGGILASNRDPSNLLVCCLYCNDVLPSRLGTKTDHLNVDVRRTPAT